MEPGNRQDIPKPAAEPAAPGPDLSSESARLPSLRDLLLIGNGGIEIDRERFQKIVKGKIREDLRRYLTSEDLLSKKDGDIIKIPIHAIVPPKFRYDNGDGEGQGVGQGEGQDGDPTGDPGEGDGAGQDAGKHILEEVSIGDIADMLGEELELPKIEPKGVDSMDTMETKYNNISKVGPDALRDNRRTLRQALLRQISEGDYDPEDPRIIPIRDDFRYKAPDIKPVQKVSAAIIYVMDVSGSMSEEKKQIARIASFWINAWLDKQYKGTEKAFIIHDMEATQVDEHTFFHTTTSGGTQISSSYLAIDDLIRRTFPPDQWNLYVFQFSDGDNWGEVDNRLCADILRDRILPYVNQFSYAQVVDRSRGSDFMGSLKSSFPSSENLVLTQIEAKHRIPEALKAMLGKGK